MTQDFSSTFDDAVSESQEAPSQGFRLNPKRMIALRLPLIVAVAVIVAIPAVTLAWIMPERTYTAKGELRFLAATPRVLYDTDRDGMSYGFYVSTQLAMMTGNTILSRVLDDPAVRALPAVKESPDPLDLLRESVRAYSNRGSELVTVQCTMPDPESAYTIVSAVMDEYLGFVSQEESREGMERLQLLRDEEERHEKELDLQLSNIADLKKQLGPSTDVEREVILESQNAIERDIATREAQKNAIRNELEYLVSVEARYGENPAEPTPISEIEDLARRDSLYIAFRDRAAQLRLEAETTRKKPGAPGYDRMMEGIAKAEEAAEKALVEARGRAIDTYRESLNQQIRQRDEEIAQLKARVDQFDQELAALGSEDSEDISLRNELDERLARAAEIRETLREVSREIRAISVESRARARVRPASEPRMPRNPDRSRRVKLAGMALFAALAAGVGAGLLRELTDQQVRGPQDLTLITRLPVIAHVPDASEDPLAKDAYLPSVVADQPNSGVAEEIRRILSRVLFPESASLELNTLLVASPSQNDGKTTIACNLAIALAQAGRRVLLVDLSARRPGVESAFHMEPAAGLAEVLHGEYAGEELLRESEYENLYVLGPGLAFRTLSGRLASREMLELLRQAEDEFEHVILDAPPALLMSDTRLLAPLVDGVFVVVGSGDSTIGMVRRCLRELEQGGARIVGVVLNKMRRMRGGYMRRNLQLYYDYAQAASAPSRPHSLPEMEVVGARRDDDEDLPDMDVVDDEEREPQEVLLLPEDERPARD